MNPSAGPLLEKTAAWLVSHSLQAAVLVLLVLAVQWLFRRQLSSRWRFALWWVVIARLLLPSGPASAVSLFNVFRPAPPAVVSASVSAPAPVLPPVAVTASTEATTSPAEVLLDLAPPSSDFVAPSAPAPAAPTLSTPRPSLAPVSAPAVSWRATLLTWRTGFALWLLGVVGLSLGVLVQVLRFRRQLAQPAVLPAPALIELLEECRREFGVSRPIELVETTAVTSPALSGLFRLRLLLPRGLGEKFSRAELRYIFLHELAHVKRGDLWLNWLVTGLQILHWFNPFVWLGFARLRADRELACDELALLRAGDQTGESYGATIIKLLEGLNRPRTIPGLVGILEDQQQMRRRITMIARFRRTGRWSVLAGLLVAAVALVTLTDAQTPTPAPAPVAPAALSVTPVTGDTAPRPDLNGTVQNKDGEPIAATVFIATAGPKSGTSPFCPSCYADCQKSAKTAADGTFHIPALDPQLRFQILAVAKGYQPKYVSKVDPAKGPVKVTLAPIELADAPPENSLHARVVDAQGKPIPDAVVEAHGIRHRDGSATWGQLADVDPLAVADANGEVWITAKKPFYQLDVRVSARGFANRIYSELASGTELHPLTLTVGASLRGRILVQGAPLTNVSVFTVGAVSVNRDSVHFTGNYTVGTDSGGHFLFVNLPPDVDYYVYGSMKTVGQYGAIPIQQFHSAADGELTDVGDLAVGPAHHVAGRVVLADGRPIPPNTRLLLGREDAWDSSQITLPPNGQFDFAGVPTEPVTLNVRISGYRISAQNQSFDAMNPYQLAGQVRGDIANLVLLLEPGKPLTPDYSSQTDWSEIRSQPLHGTEGSVRHTHQFLVTGRVLDAKTGAAVTPFQVVPGNRNNWGQTAWSPRDEAAGNDGSYAVYVEKKWPQPVLKITAAGYLPLAATLLPYEQTNADVVLTPGSGPAGTVLNPDGSPAVGADVLLVNADLNNAQWKADGHLSTWGGAKSVATTDDQGHFVLPAELDMTALAAASTNGYARVTLADFNQHPIITLQAYGHLQGTLLRPSGPGTNEDVDVSFVNNEPDFQRHINLQNHDITDAAGHFDFGAVPPGQLQISGRLKMPNSEGWQPLPLQTVTIMPGQSYNLTIQAAERPKADPHWGGSPQPQPVSIPGQSIQGTVLATNGQPAADIQVAVRVPQQYLAVGRGTFSTGLGSTVVRTDANGHFSLPMYQEAIGVIALDDDGYAAATMAELKHSPQLTLQPWGRIEGTLRSGHHFAAGKSVILTVALERNYRPTQKGTNSTTMLYSEPVMLDNSAYQVITDEQGRFAIGYVPPGKLVINEMVPLGGGSSQYRQLETVNVAPGGVTRVTEGGGERAVTGRLAFAGTNAPGDLSQAQVMLTLGSTFKTLEKLRTAKTPAERMAVFESPEFKANPPASREFPVLLAADGSFHADAVPPGKYEFSVTIPPAEGWARAGSGWMQAGSAAHNNNVPSIFVSSSQVVVPEFKAANDDATVDLGALTVSPWTFPDLGNGVSGKK